MLDAGQTLSLIEKAKDNDGFAKEKLIEENSPLIKSVVKRFLNKGIEYDDLYQLGSLGFLKAINNMIANAKEINSRRSGKRMSTNKNLVPEAKEALNKFKMEAASEVGVNLKQGYNGDLTSRQAGSVGGQMVKKMIKAYEDGMK